MKLVAAGGGLCQGTCVLKEWVEGSSCSEEDLLLQNRIVNEQPFRRLESALPFIPQGLHLLSQICNLEKQLKEKKWTQGAQKTVFHVIQSGLPEGPAMPSRWLFSHAFLPHGSRQSVGTRSAFLKTSQKTEGSCSIISPRAVCRIGHSESLWPTWSASGHKTHSRRNVLQS